MRARRLRIRLFEALRPIDAKLWLLLAALVGLLGAGAAGLFRVAVERTQDLVWGTHLLIPAAERFPWWQRLLLPAAGGLLAGLVLQLGARLVKRAASTDFMEAVSIGDGTIRTRPSLTKSGSSLLTVASGGSIGREGAMVQLSSMLGSWVGRRLKVSRPRLKLLVGCGAAAGIASAYNAPFAGALFVAEIVVGSISMETLGPLVLASVVATLATRQLFEAGPRFETDAFALASPYEILPYLVLGVLLGVAGPFFVRILRASERLFLLPRLPIAGRLLLGGLVVGAISTVRPEVWGNGQYPIDAILTGQWGWRLVLLVLVAKLVATTATVGSGAVGGVFTPTLLLGAAGGFLAGGLAGEWMPWPSAPASAYALVGMAAFLAATTHAPLTAMLVVFEMTLDYGIVLPLMLACVVAYYTSRAIDDRSIYSHVLARKAALQLRDTIERETIEPLIQPAPLSVRGETPFAEVVETFLQNRHSYLYVVDGNDRFLGAISLHDIKRHLHEEVLSGLLIASELVRPDVPCVERHSTLAWALEKARGFDGERLPVVDENRRLVGTVSKSDLLISLSMNGRREGERESAVLGTPTA